MLDEEIKFYKAATINDLSTNGGILSTAYYTSGALAEVFQHALKAERTNGSEKHRKIFIKNTNDSAANEDLIDTQVWFDVPTPGEDWAFFFVGTFVDTAANITGSERKYGCGFLTSDATVGNNTIVCDVEDVSLTGMFAAGDTIRLSNMDDPLNDAQGTEEFHVISGTPSVSGVEVTITTVDDFLGSFLVSEDSRVSSVFEPGIITPSLDNWAENGSGTYDESMYPVVMGNIGTVEQTWTLTFTDASNFTVAGDTIGAVASGTVGVDYSPNNPDFTKPYFTLEYLGFGGTWTQDDTIIFRTHPSAIPIWEKRVIPVGAASLTGDKIMLLVAGESST